MSDLYRLVYTSFRKSSCTKKEIEKILEACKRNNPSRGVTGILLHSSNRFIQYIEGSKENVEDLYELIKDDPRHTSINKRSFESIEKRLFPSWEMGYRDVENGQITFQTEATKVDRKKFDGIIKGELDFDNDGLRVLQLFFRA